MDPVKKDITDSLIKLNIDDLLNCLSEKPQTKKKFDKFVRETNNERRNRSTIIRLRDFHNWVKDTMISRVVNFVPEKRNVYLLDIAVGRGGDLNKWYQAGIKGVFGFDSNYESINSNDPFNPGAKQRLLNYNIKEKNNKLKENIHLEVANALVPTFELLDSIENYLAAHNIKGFQIISCQFALHYFFEHKQNLENVIRLVSRYLLPGGFFIGTTINGDKIKEHLSYQKIYAEKLFTITSDQTFKKNFGNKYTFVINDSEDKGNYFNTTGVSTEYAVNFKQLNELCLGYNLHPVTENYFEQYTDSTGNIRYAKTTSILDRERKLSNVFNFSDLLRFWTPKPGNGTLNADELKLNDLYSAFIFRKK
jgi:mRNA (guanine-N7-)-methyltransferase